MSKSAPPKKAQKCQKSAKKCQKVLKSAKKGGVHCIGTTIRTPQEIQFLPYAFFFLHLYFQANMSVRNTDLIYKFAKSTSSHSAVGKINFEHMLLVNNLLLLAKLSSFR